MDPFTAFSLIGSIFQFIDCGTRFILLAHNLYQTGSDKAQNYDHIEKIAEDLDIILSQLQNPKSTNENDKGLAQLAVECSKTAINLSCVLQKVKITHNIRKRDAMKVAFRSMYKKDEINSLQDQLSSCRSQMSFHLLFSLREHVSKSLDQQKECLQRLGVVHDQTLNVGGIAASILGRLASKGGKHESSEEVVSIQQDLIQVIFNTESEKTRYDPSNIQLSQSGRQRVEFLFSASLKYEDMTDRERRIATAHESTFKWVFNDTDPQEQHLPEAKWSNLREWLESDQQLYWITGKAGSGKSTLMKFSCSPTLNAPSANGVLDEEGCKVPLECCRCYSYLKKWAGPLPLVVASFYFWNSGQESQMTQAGFLRTVLYQIVSQRPEIISTIAPKHWETLCIFGHQPVYWHTQTLHNMLFQVVDILSKTSKICLFVDGLDEFDGNHDDLVSMVKNLIQINIHVKVCVASRPWNMFQDALRQRPSLQLEDLTFNDIKVFVESRLHRDPEFGKLRWRYPFFANQLIENIVVKASGVFLWVDVVVTSLLAGMSRGDRIQDFQRRLDELPPDLEKLYEKILYSLEQRYLEHAAQYFTLVETAEVPLTILQFAFADEESPDSALQMAYGSLNDYDISLRIEAMSRRLNSRCKGFLETDRGLQGIQGNDTRLPSQVTVQYLHRTLRDFIKSPKAQEYLRSSTNPRFDPSVQLCIAYLMDMKLWPGEQEHVPILDRDSKSTLMAGIVNNCIRAAAKAAPTNEAAIILLLDDLQKAVKQPSYWQQFYKDSDEGLSQLGNVFPIVQQGVSLYSDLFIQTLNKSRSMSKTFVIPASEESFLRLTVRHGVVCYVKEKAKLSRLIQECVPESLGNEHPLLLVALCCDVPDPAMVECLLDLGIDPNLQISKRNSQTLWTFAMTRVSILYTLRTECSCTEEYLAAESKWKQTLKLMYSRGGHLKKVPQSLLTSISLKLLGEIRDEVEIEPRSIVRLRGWFG